MMHYSIIFTIFKVIPYTREEEGNVFINDSYINEQNNQPRSFPFLLKVIKSFFFIPFLY